MRMSGKDETLGPGARGWPARGGKSLQARPTRVPPTVIDEIFIVGHPTPTGTLWPSFPHVQIPSLNSTS